MTGPTIAQHLAEFVEEPLESGLYITALPIGHAKDITLRALDVLAGADLVLCEDSRVTAKLCAIYGLSPKTQAFHDHNEAKVTPKVLERLAEGASVALVSDAGTPLVSDPGYRLVKAASEAGHPVHAIPGASSVLAALVVAGLPTDRFHFVGFPPSKSEARRKFFEGLERLTGSLVLFEAPHRIAASLADMAAVLGPRRAILGRELTKKFEEVVRGSLDQLAARAAEGELVLKGEFVVVVEGSASDLPETDTDEWLRRALKKAPLREAVDAVALVSGLPRRPLYQRALELTGEKDREAD